MRDFVARAQLSEPVMIGWVVCGFNSVAEMRSGRRSIGEPRAAILRAR